MFLFSNEEKKNRNFRSHHSGPPPKEKINMYFMKKYIPKLTMSG